MEQKIKEKSSEELLNELVKYLKNHGDWEILCKVHEYRFKKLSEDYIDCISNS